ncbi:subtilisin-like protease SBT4.4 [Macadamia integrifolia]|uniref:subtilisin-like protease SBT4.4 n=1 Tax=Macadamia integrifolia TaxID=60698 RepID=UPI001C4E7DD1|nr:subtilisin-like protease SBT4.4 [Macadamia integrifolia]
MAKFFLGSSFSHPFFLLLFPLVLAVCIRCDVVEEDRKVYIVYMGALSKDEGYSPASLTSQHHSIMEEVLDDSSINDNFVRSYRRSFNGFAAKLNEQERQKLASKEGVVSVFPSRTLQLETTRSWDFIGLSKAAKRIPSAESDVIIGVIDSGIWSKSESFSDKGFGPPPKKWKGVCNGGQTNFTCNNKIIGARFYKSDSVIDTKGHGTHVASTIAGNLVSNVDFYGITGGNARGGVPSARIAAYKVCTLEGCDEYEILSAFDDAIADGVDIISISIGSGSFSDFDSNSVAIGAFHAMEYGILTSHSAGNNGPAGQTTASLAPWILSVAASSTGRRIIDKVVLGDGKVLKGSTINSFTLDGTNHPLIYGKGAAVPNCDEASARLCRDGCLDNNLVKGKIVLCDNLAVVTETVRSGVLGTVMSADRGSDYSIPNPLPAAHLSTQTAELVKSYINSTKNPTANILKSEVVNDSSAPTIASFSSRGPNGITPDILKPDISAPGVEILAAYPPSVSLTNNDNDKRRVKFNILSGTSMACPHASGAAAYVKTFHPNWSPSTIKSALMTTASPMNPTKNPEAEFAYGAGNINPVKAINPGLVYETLKEDYIKFLCNIGWDTNRVQMVSGDNSSCPQGTKGTALDLNYPSMTAYIQQKDKPFVVNFTRTVKNVGLANSTYKASVINSHSNITIKVEPSVLSVKSLNEDKSFVVTVSGSKLESMSMVSASLVWSDGTHTVRSPIIVHPFPGRSI